MANRRNYNNQSWQDEIDPLAEHFKETHINGNHGISKRRNQRGAFDKAHYKPVTKYQSIPGKLNSVIGGQKIFWQLYCKINKTERVFSDP